MNDNINNTNNENTTENEALNLDATSTESTVEAVSAETPEATAENAAPTESTAPQSPERPRYEQPTSQSQPQTNYGGYYYNQQNVNRQNPYQQNQGYYSQQQYTGGYYAQPSQYAPEKKSKKKSGKALVALLVVGCIVLSTAFGVCGALITSRIIDNTQTMVNPNVSDNDNGLIGDKEPAKDSAAAKPNTNPSVIIRNENVDNTARFSDNPVVNAAAIARDSVVEITTETVQTSTFYGQYVTQGAGSGVIITEDGYIITCAHVIDGATNVIVRLADGSETPATVIGSDSQTDIAVIRIEGTAGLKAALLGDSDTLMVGETAVAIGNPLGELGGSVSAGIISALDREIKIDGDVYNLLQTTAAINPGNSGGGLFNANGELIGIVNAKQAGDAIEGLGFSIPINSALDIAEQLINNGYISGRVRLGVSVVDVTSNTNSYKLYSEFPQLMNYITAYGVYFIEYSDGQSGDLKFGDRIVAIDGTTVENQSAIRTILRDYEVGDTVTVTVARLSVNGRQTQSKMVDVSLTLIEEIPEKAE